MYYHPWTTIPLMRSVVQALESKNSCSSWACMCRCAVTLPWPQHHVMILNHPYGTYIKYVASPDINYWARVTIDTECSPSMAKSWLLTLGYGVHWVAAVVPDDAGHIAILMLYTNKGFHDLALLWIWLSYRHHTHPTPACCPIFGGIWDISLRAYGVLDETCGPRLSRPCCHIHVICTQSVL